MWLVSTIGPPTPKSVRRIDSLTAGWMKDQRDPASPSVNMRGQYTAKYRARARHHHAPPQVHWISGTIRLTRPPTNGTWSGRAVW